MDDYKKTLDELRHSLLNLHKNLLEYQRFCYEAEHAKIPSTGAYFELVTGHKDFAWLKTISELIVSIDTVLDGKKDKGINIKDLVKYTKVLFSSKQPLNHFGKKYLNAIQQSPGVALAHAKVMKLLK